MADQASRKRRGTKLVRKNTMRTNFHKPKRQSLISRNSAAAGKKVTPDSSLDDDSEAMNALVEMNSDVAGYDPGWAELIAEADEVPLEVSFALASACTPAKPSPPAVTSTRWRSGTSSQSESLS